MDNVSIKVKKNTVYKTISTVVAKDPRLSYKARGVMFYLLSQSDNWKGQVFNIVESSKQDGVIAVRSALKELVTLGYAKLKKTVGEGGKFTGSYYEVSEVCKVPKKSK